MSHAGKPEVYSVDLFDLVVLLINVLKAKDHPDIGYANIEESIKTLYTRMRRKTTKVKSTELEAALWACVMMDEQGCFFHPKGVSLKSFLFSMFNARLYDKNFNEIYCLISDKPKMGRPKKR